MQIDIYTKDDLFKVQQAIEKGSKHIVLNFCHMVAIQEFKTILNLAKAKDVELKIIGKIEEADRARLSLYEPEIDPAILEEYKVIIRDYIVEASVGVYKHEYKIKQKLCFNLCLKALKPKHNANITNIFSYDIVTDTINAIIEHNHIELLENLAEQICDILLENSLIKSVSIRIEKLGLIENAAIGIELCRTKNST